MSIQEKVVASVFSEALTSQDKAREFLTDPARAFLEAGLVFPNLDPLDSSQFNTHLKSIAGNIMQKVELVSMGNILPGADSVASCVICKVSAITISAVIVGLGAAGLVVLSVTSPVVIALAAFAAVSAPIALAFILGLSATIVASVVAVAAEICTWTKACG